MTIVTVLQRGQSLTETSSSSFGAAAVQTQTLKPRVSTVTQVGHAQAPAGKVESDWADHVWGREIAHFSNDEYSLREFTVLPGCVTPLHLHLSSHETYLVISGSGEVEVLFDGKPHRTFLKAGDSYVFPAGLPHCLVAGTDPVHVIVGGESYSAEDIVVISQAMCS
jgi:quercetin dioxygenase-like cupin family protein